MSTIVNDADVAAVLIDKWYEVADGTYQSNAPHFSFVERWNMQQMIGLISSIRAWRVAD